MALPFLSGWNNRIAIDVTEDGGGTKADYSIKLDAFYNCCPIEADSCTQFLYRPAVRYSGTHDRTYIAGANAAGVVTIRQWDEDDKELSAAVQLWNFAYHDDHNGCSIIVLQHQTGGLAAENGTILVGAVQTNNLVASRYIYSRRSDNAEDISSWGNSVTVDQDEGNAYVHLVECDNGTIYCFYRALKGTNDYHFCYRTLTLNADPDSDAWSAETVFCSLGDGEVVYCKPWQDLDDGNVIHFAFSHRDIATTRYEDVYYIQLDSGTPKDILGNTKTLPLDWSDADHTPDTVYSSTDSPTHDTIIWDIKCDGAGNPYILFIDATDLITVKDGVGNIYRAYYDSGWQCDDTGINTVRFGHGTDGVGPFYFGGAEFDEGNPDVIYAAVPDGSDNAQIQAWENVSGTWYIADGNNGTTAVNGDGKITQASPGDNFRPIHVLHGQGFFEILWFYSERYEAINDWEAIRFAYPGFSNGKYIAFKKNCRTDFGDLRITEDDGESLLGYEGQPFIADKVDSWRTLVFAMAGTVPAAAGTVSIYCYHNNPSATNDDDANVISGVVYFADHFDGSAVDTTDRWTKISGDDSVVADSLIELTCSAADYALYDQKVANYPGVIYSGTTYYEWYARVKGSDATPSCAIGWRDAAGDWTERGRIVGATNVGDGNKAYCQSYRNNTGTSTLTAASWDITNWHTWKMDWIVNRNRFYKLTDIATLGDTHKVGSLINTTTTNVSDENQIMHLMEGAGTQGTLYCDWVMLRVETSPAPIVTVASAGEEKLRRILITHV